MACKFYITDQAGFTELNERLNTAFGYPTADGSTLTYTEPLVNKNSGAYAIVVEQRCLPYISGEQINALVEQSDLIAQGGWYPDEEKRNG